MKQIHSDGRCLTVRDVGDTLVVLEALPGRPLPLFDHEIMEDGVARIFCKELINSGYKRVK